MTAMLRCELFPSDLDGAAQFYVRVLRFAVARDARASGAPYIALLRDGIRLGLAGRDDVSPHSDRRPPAGVELVLEVDDVDDERASVAAAGWAVVEETTARPWGLRDFRLLDPDGYYWRITSRSP